MFVEKARDGLRLDPPGVGRRRERSCAGSACNHCCGMTRPNGGPATAGAAARPFRSLPSASPQRGIPQVRQLWQRAARPRHPRRCGPQPIRQTPALARPLRHDIRLAGRSGRTIFVLSSARARGSGETRRPTLGFTPAPPLRTRTGPWKHDRELKPTSRPFPRLKALPDLLSQNLTRSGWSFRPRP